MNSYTLRNKIGEGGYGRVYAAKRKSDGLPVAIKISNKSTHTETQILQMIKGTPGVVQYIDHFTEKKNNFIVMNLCEGMDLYDYINKKGGVQESEANAIMMQVIDVLKQLEWEYNIYHNDIKDENIMVNLKTKKITLIDFGGATLGGLTEGETFRGTDVFAPPEWFKFEEYDPSTATVWSLGIVMATMLEGNIPFQKPVEIMFAHHGSKNPFVQATLLKDPAKRPLLKNITI